jgi:CheY-like chemotaxis protein/two-component sensor histidine kinase
VLFKRNFNIFKPKNTAVKSAVNADFYRELKSSIHVLKGMSQLAMESKNMDSLKENLSAVKLATDELVFLVDNLHTIQEIESDTLRINKEKFSLISYLENLFVLTNAKAKVKQSNFRQMVYEGVPDWVQFDKTKLSLILLNLLNNAIRFSNGNDIEVEVKLIARRKLGKQNCSKIEIEISNEGSGISKELLALIQQEKFEKISGNGLYIVNELTKKLGGQFKINSIKSQGVMVKLQFEFEETDEQNIGFSNKNLKKLNKHILLADDNVMNQKFLEKVLQDAGYQCDCVSNGAEVLEALTQKSYNMLLLDVHMPVLDGIATCKRIKSEKYFNRHSQMPIVGLTANAQLRMKKKCQDVGMNDVLNKPFNKEQLLQIVNDLI